MIHPEPSPLAGQTLDVALRRPGRTVRGTLTVQDWWDRIAGRSWRDCHGMVGVAFYAMRAGHDARAGDLRMANDDVVYGTLTVGARQVGKVLVHVSELGTGDTLQRARSQAKPNLYDVLSEVDAAGAETVQLDQAVDELTHLARGGRLTPTGDHREINVANSQLVGMSAGRPPVIHVGLAWSVMDPDDALRHAAWLVAIAQPYATHPFAAVLQAVQRT